jgi:hypothetical protein
VTTATGRAVATTGGSSSDGVIEDLVMAPASGGRRAGTSCELAKAAPWVPAIACGTACDPVAVALRSDAPD